MGVCVPEEPVFVELFPSDGSGWWVELLFVGVGVLDFPPRNVLHDFGLSVVRGEGSSEHVSVLFGLEQRKEVDSGGELLTGEFNVLPVPLDDFGKPVGRHGNKPGKPDGRSEASRGEVPLPLEGLVPGLWREILMMGHFSVLEEESNKRERNCSPQE